MKEKYVPIDYQIIMFDNQDVIMTSAEVWGGESADNSTANCNIEENEKYA